MWNEVNATAGLEAIDIILYANNDPEESREEDIDWQIVSDAIDRLASVVNKYMLNAMDSISQIQVKLIEIEKDEKYEAK